MTHTKSNKVFFSFLGTCQYIRDFVLRSFEKKEHIVIESLLDQDVAVDIWKMYNDQPENFSVFGTDRCFNQAEFGLGLAYLINDQFAINASYDIDVGSKRQQQEFNFELNYRF